MIDQTEFIHAFEDTALKPWLEQIARQAAETLAVSSHGDLPQWRKVLQQLPRIKPTSMELDADTVRIGEHADCDDATRATLRDLLQQLRPWRKGPFEIFDIKIDTEWRSDWKWQRLQSHITPLADRLVLDVGCGSGYHCWRMLGAGAGHVLGVDPSQLYVAQFYAVKHFVGRANNFVLPLSLEALPDNMPVFDTVFSMGVIYHRRSALDHLQRLNNCLRPAGELVLESLVVEGDANETVAPKGRYARMRNVWLIPSCQTLQVWLERSGFKDVRLIDVTKTTPGEQRTTDWMPFESLTQALDAEDADKTVEGYPAPRRAIFLASKS